MMMKSCIQICNSVSLNFLVTVKAASHDCVIRTSQPKTVVKAENEVWFYSKVTIALYHNTLVKTVII